MNFYMSVFCTYVHSNRLDKFSNYHFKNYFFLFKLSLWLFNFSQVERKYKHLTSTNIRRTEKSEFYKLLIINSLSVKP